ncbi:MAG TPA: hypothetical protein VES65_00265, partial [Solirubrobacteraceae bacterium]|nr:hypothetical protein [Solirubrobacteraceae bacterium]
MSAGTRQERIIEIVGAARARPSRFRDEHITMAHGAGGKASQSLIEGLLLPAFANDALALLGDAGIVPAGATAGSTQSGD